jgi:hypothetical protein
MTGIGGNAGDWADADADRATTRSEAEHRNFKFDPAL